VTFHCSRQAGADDVLAFSALDFDLRTRREAREPALVTRRVAGLWAEAAMVEPFHRHRDQAANHLDCGHEENKSRQREFNRPEGQGHLFVRIGSKNVAQHELLDNSDAQAMLGENCCELVHHAEESNK
jgi:hypothetical protein